MKDKDKKQLFSYLDDEDLTFTKEDRAKTFNKIHQKEREKQNNTSQSRRINRLGPILGSVVVIILAIGLLIPTLYSQESADQQQASQQNDSSFSALLIGENLASHRSEFNILMTYNNSDKSVNLVPIPRDAYVEILNAEGDSLEKDKLTHAYAFSRSPEAVLTTVSHLFDFPIDYYSVIPTEEIKKTLGISEGVEREEVVKEDRVGKLIKEQLSISQFKDLINGSQSNFPTEIFNQFDNNLESIQVIDMEEGIEEKIINGIYYKKINNSVLEETSQKLKQHLGE
ncbi:transcriptional regulator [Oceanobacillus picturae]|jgi:LytR_cpsA_psr family|uniref:Transcriptional regulator n=1 Tax=Oceanobacillus picturae TaxID=171693 RepID=W9B7Q1_9BACI|nr:LCP family protein [Oceanobacillus picturae]GAQ16318.1 transcriptional regulator [Oceanobacillus picturae]CDO02620.1 Putative transcriptional regulator YwtF [Oceanobacillus picturae]